MNTGRLVFEANGVSHDFAEKTLIKGFSVKIIRGNRIGIIGANGIGKSALLLVLAVNRDGWQNTI
jgi:ATP-binding cassette subfamily F protein uup